MKSFLSAFFFRTDVHGRRHWNVRPWRWLCAVLLAAAFLFSYGLDIQVLEGSMIASRLMGFHLVDLYGGMEVIAAHGEIAANLALGMLLVFVVYWILGGRTYCAWACPFGLLSEWGEILHQYLVRKGWIVKRKKITTRVKYWTAAMFLLMSAASGYLVFESLNVVGILSRCLIYGLWESGLVVLAVLFFEVFFYRRFWCRSFCPSGAVFGLLNSFSVIRISADRSLCDNCGKCALQCHVPEALTPVFVSKKGKFFLSSTDCTMCSKCMDACPRDVFHFDHRLKKFL